MQFVVNEQQKIIKRKINENTSIEQEKKGIKQEKNGKMKETSGQISRIIVNFGAFDGWTAGKKSKNIKHQAQQFKKRKKKEHVRGRRGSNNSDVVPQRLYVEWQCEDYPPVFTTRSGGIGDVLFVVGVASGGKVGSNGKRERVCKIMVDVAGKGQKKTKIKHGVNELSNEEINK